MTVDQNAILKVQKPRKNKMNLTGTKLFSQNIYDIDGYIQGVQMEKQ